MNMYPSRSDSGIRQNLKRFSKGIIVLSLVLIDAPLSLAMADDLNVVELFTSQGCNSCPTADKLLAKIAANDSSILNLEFHVDYWNQLQYGSAGSWQDPFSSAEFTKRQRIYSKRQLLGENGVYTPQAVVNGVYGLVGSNRRELKNSLSVDSPRPASVNIVRTDENTLSLSVNIAGPMSADVSLISYLLKTRTEISSGENHGKTMVNHNVVVDILDIGTYSGAENEAIEVDHQALENLGCAVLVQSQGQGAILGAARCP